VGTSLRLQNSQLRSPDEPTGRANARPMTGSAKSGTSETPVPDFAALILGYGYYGYCVAELRRSLSGADQKRGKQ